MDNKLKKICIILGIVYYLVWTIYLGSLRIPGIMICFTWVIPLFLALLPTKFAIKTNLFSDIREDFISPVYKIEEDSWGDNTVSKYSIGYNIWDNGWAMFFPLILLFRFKQPNFENSFPINSKELQLILDDIRSPKEMYLIIKQELDKTYYNEIFAKKREEEKLKEINKEYYNNFKTK